MAIHTDEERMDWLDQTWVKVNKFPSFFWMSDRTDVHPDYRNTHALSSRSLREAIDAELDAEQQPAAKRLRDG